MIVLATLAAIDDGNFFLFVLSVASVTYTKSLTKRLANWIRSGERKKRSPAILLCRFTSLLMALSVRGQTILDWSIVCQQFVMSNFALS